MSGMRFSCGRRIFVGPLFADQGGLSIIELLVALSLGLLVAMAAIALLLSSKAGYTEQDEGTRLQETGRYAIESVTRAVRQTAYENWDRDEAPIVATGVISANIAGLDAQSLKDVDSPGLTGTGSASVNGSDVLAVRFFGVGPGTKGDGTVLNCAGFSVGAPRSQASASEDRGWSIFYVAKGTGGEPELRCKFHGRTKWDSDAIARGVESFQVLYGVDTDADGLPNQFLTASAINRLDDALVPAGADSTVSTGDKNRKTYWKKVVVIKVALLVRGSQNAGPGDADARYDLFGKAYSDANAAVDQGVLIKASGLPVTVRGRLRKVFSITIQLRNRMGGSS